MRIYTTIYLYKVLEYYILIRHSFKALGFSQLKLTPKGNFVYSLESIKDEFEKEKERFQYKVPTKIE